MKSVLIAYVPVLHVGYTKLIQRYPEAEVWVVDDAYLDQFRPLQKDVRRLPAIYTVVALKSIFPGRKIDIFDADAVADLQKLKKLQVIAPQDEVMEILLDQWKLHKNVKWDSVFLRWTRKNSEQEKVVQANATVTHDELAQKFMKSAGEFAQRSSDWWRQVASVLVRDGKVVLAAYNTHSPVPYSEYRDGDPRANYSSGERIELSTSIHSEAALIAAAAERGISTAGCDLYVTTFPCPYCARMLAQSGIQRVFFATGYSLVDGDQVLKSAGIEVVQVVSK